MRLVVVVMVIFASLLTVFWFGSDTTWNLFPPDFLGYYENHGQKLLQGRLDVDCDAIAWEAFRKDGLCYGYFGPVPAFFRVFLSFLLPWYAYHWTLISTLAGTLFSLLIVRKLIAKALESIPVLSVNERTFIEGLLLLNAGVGSTLLILTAPVSIYNEAILWGSAFTLASMLFLTEYIESARLRDALLAITMAAFAVNTRTNIGFGALMALFLVFGSALSANLLQIKRLTMCISPYLPVRITEYVRLNLMLTLLVLIISASPFVWNKLKFGEFSLYPYKYYGAVSPERAARTGKNFVQPGNFFFNAKHYLDFSGIPSSLVFPYIKLAPKEWGWREKPAVHFDTGEPFIPLTGSMSLWMLLSVSALCGIFNGPNYLRTRAIPVLGCLAGGGIILILATVAPRYTHDFFPFLMLAGSGGLFFLGRLSGKLRFVLYLAGVLLTVISIYMNAAFCLLTPYAGIQLQNKLLVTRAWLDGSTINSPVVAGQVASAENGIIADTANGIWGVVLKGNIPPGLAIGAKIHFSVSGVRTVREIHKQEDMVIAIVDGPLLPSGDGTPAMVKYRRIPCDTVDCGATRQDQ